MYVECIAYPLHKHAVMYTLASNGMMSIGCILKSGFWVVREEKYGKKKGGRDWSFILGGRGGFQQAANGHTMLK